MLQFRLFGIPISVHVTFLFIAVLGMSTYRGVDIAIWTAAAFVSILLHEMGHALTARAFGAVGVEVTLYGLGGVTRYSHGSEMSNGRSFVISAAGSTAGIVVGGTVLLLGRNGVFNGASPEMVVFLNSFVFTALVWGVLNWVPIVPLDGGHMVRHLVGMVNEPKAPLISQIVTWISVAIIVPWALLNGYQFAAIIVVMFAASGFREFRAETRPKRPTPPPAPTERRDPPEFPI